MECPASAFSTAGGSKAASRESPAGPSESSTAILDSTDTTAIDAASLYEKLENVVIPLYYNERERFLDIMRHSIALNGAFFNSQRMLLQYVLNAYFE